MRKFRCAQFSFLTLTQSIHNPYSDLASGTLQHIWDGLSHDLQLVGGIAGTYPSFAFTPNDDAIIIWSAGKIYHVPLAMNKHGERVSAGEPQIIPFQAHIEKRIAETRSSKTDIKSVETAETQRVYAFHELRVDEAGEATSAGRFVSDSFRMAYFVTDISIGYLGVCFDPDA